MRDPQAAQVDVDDLKAALSAVDAQEVFMTAASPGVVSLFFRNEHYPTEEAYLFAIAEAMRQEYETIAGPASSCRSTAPISGWDGISSTPT